MYSDDAELRPILREYGDFFQAELPPGLLPSREVDHAIKLVPDAKSPYRAAYQLSFAELAAARDYVD